MKNWKLIASGMDLGIPEPDLDKIAPVIDAMEGAFRPLASVIPHETEPAVVFHPVPEELP